MFELYLDGVLVSSSKYFSEIYDIIFHEIITWKVENLKERVKFFIDDLFSNGYAVLRFYVQYLDSNHENQIDSIEIEVNHVRNT